MRMAKRPLVFCSCCFKVVDREGMFLCEENERTKRYYHVECEPYLNKKEISLLERIAALDQEKQHEIYTALYQWGHRI